MESSCFSSASDASTLIDRRSFLLAGSAALVAPVASSVLFNRPSEEAAVCGSCWAGASREEQEAEQIQPQLVVSLTEICSSFSNQVSRCVGRPSQEWTREELKLLQLHLLTLREKAGLCLVEDLSWCRRTPESRSCLLRILRRADARLVSFLAVAEQQHPTFACSPKEVSERLVRQLESAFRQAEPAGARMGVVLLGRNRPSLSPATLWKNLRDNLRRCAEWAERRGVVLLLNAWEHVADLRLCGQLRLGWSEAWKLCQEVGSKACQLSVWVPWDKIQQAASCETAGEESFDGAGFVATLKHTAAARRVGLVRVSGHGCNSPKSRSRCVNSSCWFPKTALPRTAFSSNLLQPQQNKPGRVWTGTAASEQISKERQRGPASNFLPNKKAELRVPKELNVCLEVLAQAHYSGFVCVEGVRV